MGDVIDLNKRIWKRVEGKTVLETKENPYGAGLLIVYTDGTEMEVSGDYENLKLHEPKAK